MSLANVSSIDVSGATPAQLNPLLNAIMTQAIAQGRSVDMSGVMTAPEGDPSLQQKQQGGGGENKMAKFYAENHLVAPFTDIHMPFGNVDSFGEIKFP